MHHVKNTSHYTALYFSKPVSCLSWAPIGGGRRNGIRYVINRTLPKDNIRTILDLQADAKQFIAERGMQLPKTIAMLTTASQTFLGRAIVRSNKGLLISTYCTVGLGNAVAPGEHAAYDEEAGQIPVQSGTINIIITINRNLTENAALELMHTVAMAKASVMVDLGIVNRSGKIKLATGTDCQAICWDPNHKTTLQFAGLHTRLAELVSNSIREAMISSLAKRLGVNPKSEAELFNLALSRLSATR
ncbi:MAG: adenosylcobinamide amidohydrolase [Patescibacteria group bacterium]|nr:adenosylcobinamide amidohydrolase [Patescibacteria group bacterium]